MPGRSPPPGPAKQAASTSAAVHPLWPGATASSAAQMWPIMRSRAAQASRAGRRASRRNGACRRAEQLDGVVVNCRHSYRLPACMDAPVRASRCDCMHSIQHRPALSRQPGSPPCCTPAAAAAPEGCRVRRLGQPPAAGSAPGAHTWQTRSAGTAAGWPACSPPPVGSADGSVALCGT